METQLKLLLTEGAPGPVEACGGGVLCRQHGTRENQVLMEMPSGPQPMKRCDKETVLGSDKLEDGCCTLG